MQAFLGYPIEAQGEIEGNGLRHAAMCELELDGMEFREIGAVGFKRSHQSEMLQGRRVELVRRAAQVVRELFDALAQGSELVADGLGRTRQVPFQQAYLVCQHGHPLVHVVVKFPRQALAFLFLRREQVRRQSSEFFLALAQCVLGELALGDIDARADDTGQGAVCRTMRDTRPCDEAVAAVLADPGAFVAPHRFHAIAEGRELSFRRLYVLRREQRIPETPVLHFLERVARRLLAGGVEAGDGAIRATDDDQRTGEVQKGGGEVSFGDRFIARQSHQFEAALHGVDVHERHQYPACLVAGALVRPHAKGVPPPIAALHIAFHHGNVVDHFRDLPVQLGGIDVGLDIADGPAHIARNQIQQPFRRGGEAPDSPVRPQDHDRNVHPDQQVAQIVGELAQFRVSILQLIVERGQFFVGRL